MSRGAIIERVVVRTVRISGKTEWTFVSVHCSDGIVGVGEASINGFAPELKAFGANIETRILGQRALPNVLANLANDIRGGLVQRALVSAVEQALWDAQGKRLDVPVCDLLGGQVRENVTLYANINRGISRRSPDGFADAAQRAADAGFRYIKIAPFDGLGETEPLNAEVAFELGLSRIEAVCEAVGDGKSVLVDCHWRLDEAMAVRLLKDAARLQLFWVECPIPETSQQLPSLRRLRSTATSLGVRLAGMEKGTCVQSFMPYILEHIYDVLMPDVKYDGGMVEMQRVAALASAAGIFIAPHNPTGPIAHAASVHVAAVLPNLLFLESQFDESSKFNTLVKKPIEPHNGEVTVPDAPGLGAELNEEFIQEVEI